VEAKQQDAGRIVSKDFVSFSGVASFTIRRLHAGTINSSMGLGGKGSFFLAAFVACCFHPLCLIPASSFCHAYSASALWYSSHQSASIVRSGVMCWAREGVVFSPDSATIAPQRFDTTSHRVSRTFG